MIRRQVSNKESKRVTSRIVEENKLEEIIYDKGIKLDKESTIVKRKKKERGRWIDTKTKKVRELPQDLLKRIN